MEKACAKASSLLVREEALLVIIDAQERLMPAVAEKEAVTENILRLARFARIIGLPVIATEQEKLGTTLSEVSEAVEDFAAIPKAHFNCFSVEEFARRLAASGRKSLILCGVEAHICVTQTALQAAPAFGVHVVSDAVSSRTLDNKRIALDRMAQAGAVISSAEMVIYELLRRAGTEEFRAALALVK